MYRARDTRLDRDVAIKILPDAFVADPERVAHFQREAKTLASLNQPNIGGITALVMEEGTLRCGCLSRIRGCRDRCAHGVDVLTIDELLTRLAAFDARKSRVIERRYFGGLSLDETAQLMQISLATVDRDWRAARAWLY